MLILGRRLDEGITITVPPSTTSTIVHVKVVAFKNNHIRLGLSAPNEVVIARDELPDRESD